MARGVDDLDAVGDALVRALASYALEHHDDRRTQPEGCCRDANPLNDLASRLGPIPPPAGRTGTDDVRGVDENHTTASHDSRALATVHGTRCASFAQGVKDAPRGMLAASPKRLGAPANATNGWASVRDES